MSFRARLIGISICVGLLYLMTWGRPLVSRVISLDSSITGMISTIGLGIGCIVVGLWLAKSGIVSLWRAVTFAKVSCGSCRGTGAGSHYATREVVDINGNVGTETVLVHHCGPCGGQGWTYSGSLQSGGFMSVGGVGLVLIGSILVSEWRSLNNSPVAKREREQAASPTGNATAPAVKASGQNEQIILVGKETETSGHVWEIRATLSPKFDGQLTFKLIRVPPGSPLARRQHASATMQVRGTFEQDRLTLTGSDVSDPSLIAPGRYELQIDANRRTFQGNLPNGQGILGGTVENWPGS